MKTMSIIFGLLSALILVIELQFFFDRFDESIIYDMMFDINTYPFYVQNIIILIPMGYMLYAANFGLFDFD